MFWERKGCPLGQDESGRITIEEFLKNGVYCEKNSVVTVTKASRQEDTGDWRVRLMCGGGSTEATGHVNVIDVPRAPRCLNLDEVRAEYCRISWEKPEDDGGTEITGYTVNLLDLSQGEWVTVAEPTSLTAEIKNLRPGHLYRFPESKTTEPSMIFLNNANVYISIVAMIVNDTDSFLRVEVFANNKEGASPPTRLKVASSRVILICWKLVCQNVLTYISFRTL